MWNPREEFWCRQRGGLRVRTAAAHLGLWQIGRVMEKPELVGKDRMRLATEGCMLLRFDSQGDFGEYRQPMITHATTPKVEHQNEREENPVECGSCMMLKYEWRQLDEATNWSSELRFANAHMQLGMLIGWRRSVIRTNTPMNNFGAHLNQKQRDLLSSTVSQKPGEEILYSGRLHSELRI